MLLKITPVDVQSTLFTRRTHEFIPSGGLSMVRNALNRKRLSFEGLFWLTSMIVLALLFGFFVRLSIERSGNHRFLMLSTALLLCPVFITVFEAILLDHVYVLDLWNRFFFPFLFAFVSLNSPKGTDNVVNLWITLFLALFFLVRHTLILVIKLLLRPIQADKYRLSLVQGRSMEPTILSEDVIVVSPEVHDINPGRILDVKVPMRYSSKARNIVHRLVWTDGEVIQTRGDNNDHLDPKMPLENVEGMVVAVLRGNGKNIEVEAFLEGFHPPEEVLAGARRILLKYSRVKSLSKPLGIYIPLTVSLIITVSVMGLL